MRISFVWDWISEDSQTHTWRDGLAAAVKELMNRGHEVQFLTCGKTDYVLHHPYFDIQVSTDIKRDVAGWQPDVVLMWGDTTRPNAEPVSELGIPMALCFAGGEVGGGTQGYFQHVFVESEVYKSGFIRRHIPVSIAFGTNTELFKPTPQPKLIDTLMVGTFALWKRHELYAKSVEGLRSLAVGYMYDDHEQECWQVCLDHGTTILPHVSAETLRYLYAASKVCVIPSLSSGGSQRTVLEAMSMNLPLVVCDSDKFDYVEGQEVLRVDPTIPAIREAVEASLDKEVNTRDFILENWSEFTYADALEKGLYEIV